MKSNIFFSGVICSLLFSCTDENLIEKFEQDKECESITMTASDFINDTNSRTSFLIDKDGATFSWDENDTVGIFPDKGRQVDFPINSKEGSHTAYFNGGGWALKPSSNYTAYYPMQGKFYLDKTAIPVIYEGQTQEGNCSTKHLGRYDYMVSKAATPDKGNITFNFEHISSFLQISFHAIPKLVSVSLSVDEPLFTLEGTIDLTQNTPSITPTRKDNTILFATNNMETSTPEQGYKVYGLIAPVDLSAKMITVQAKDVFGQTYEYTTQGKNFQAGKIYALDSKVAELVSGVKFSNTLSDVSHDKGNIYTVSFECASSRQISPKDYLVSALDSPFPIYVTNESGTGSNIVVYTKADFIQLNEDCSYMFRNCGNLRELQHLNKLITSRVKKMNYVFGRNGKMYSIDMRGFNTQNVTEMDTMFDSCINLHYIDMSSFDLRNLQSKNDVCYLCESLLLITCSPETKAILKDLVTFPVSWENGETGEMMP